MKLVSSIALLLILLSTACSQDSPFGGADFKANNKNLNPAEDEPDYPEGFFTDEEESEEGLEQEKSEESDDFVFVPKSDFSVTKWNECSEDVTGNYSTFGCSKNRRMAVIFKGLMADSIYSCVDKALKATGYSHSAEKIHIQHMGISCDRAHNRRSLHCQERAIDIKALKVNLTNGGFAQFSYSKLGNQKFYESLRDCWGRSVVRGNECPIRRSYARTGSIGREDRRHGRHLHLSLPVCHAGRHVGSYFLK